MTNTKEKLIKVGKSVLISAAGVAIATAIDGLTAIDYIVTVGEKTYDLTAAVTGACAVLANMIKMAFPELVPYFKKS